MSKNMRLVLALKRKGLTRERERQRKEVKEVEGRELRGEEGLKGLLEGGSTTEIDEQ